MKRNLPIIILLLGSLLTACSAQQQNESLQSSTEATETAAVPETSQSSNNAINDETVVTSEEPTPTASSEQETSITALYRMSEAYRFVPIEESTSSKVVLLTFDDGPKDETVLTSMLDTLDKHKAKAIFS